MKLVLPALIRTALCGLASASILPSASASDLPVVPGHRVIELAPDGMWTWYNDERAIIHDGKLIAGHVTRDGHVSVGAVDLTSGRITQSGHLSSWSEPDDHDNPSLTVLPDGRVLAIYSRHGTTKSFEFRTTVAGSDITRWNPEASFSDPESTVGFTYSQCYRLSAEAKNGNGGRLYNFLRSDNFDPNLLWSDDNGRTWSQMVHLIRQGDRGTRPYIKLTGNGRDRIDFIITEAHPNNFLNSVYHGYLRYDEAAGGVSFHRTDGSLLKTLPKIVAGDPLTVGDFSLIYDGNSPKTGRGWTHDIAHDPKGQLAAVYSSRAADNDLRYRYGRWNPGTKRWDDQQIAFAGNYLYEREADYTGGITIDPEDADTVFLSSNVNIATGAATISGQHELYRGTTSDAGRTWTWTQLTQDSPVRNIRPMVPRRASGPPILVWCRGRYDTYKDYSTRIMALLPDSADPSSLVQPAHAAGFPFKLPATKPARPLSEAMNRLYDQYAAPGPEWSELYSNFKFTPIEGLDYNDHDGTISRRDPSKIIRVGGKYYVWYTKRHTETPPRGAQLATDTIPSSDWDLSEIWYATSTDGFTWTEQGLAIPRPPKPQPGWRSVSTTDILIWKGKYYLYYQGFLEISGRRGDDCPVTASVADSPDGPWRPAGKIVIENGAPGEWDQYSIHDPYPLVHDGKIFIYYKSDSNGKPFLVRMHGLATADDPFGPFTKHPLNPVMNSGHETILFPFKTGIASLAVHNGLEHNTVQYAPDGVNFHVESTATFLPIAAGPYIADAFTDTKDGRGITWGLSHFTGMGTRETRHSILARFDCDLSQDVDDPDMKRTDLGLQPEVYFTQKLSKEQRRRIDAANQQMPDKP